MSGSAKLPTPKTFRVRTKLTVNRLMILLDVYRGTLDISRHLGTYEEDVHSLRAAELIAYTDDYEDEFVCTDKGSTLVERLMKMARMEVDDAGNPTK